MRFPYILLLLLLLSLQGSAQKSYTDQIRFLATYQYSYQPDSTDLESVKSEEMQLYLGTASSRFSSTGKVMKDYILANRSKSSQSTAKFAQFQSQVPPTTIHYHIFKHYSSQELSFTESVIKDKFRYVQNLNLFDWKIQEDKKEIHGYQVQKASTRFAGRDYVAWFSPEIPIPDGPYKFNGLPGLILEIRDTKDFHVFQLIQFESFEESNEIEFDSRTFLTTTREKFLQVKKEFDQDPISAVERSGITFGFKPGQREKMHQEHLQQIRKRNNPLELD